MTYPFRVLVGLVALATAVTAHAQYFWIGQASTDDFSDPANWRNGQVPPNNSGTVILLASSPRTDITFASSTYSLQQIRLSDDTDHYIHASTPLTLDLSYGIYQLDSSESNFIRFDPNITIDLTGGQTWDNGGGQIVVQGHIIGTGPLTLANSGPSASGAIYFTDTTTGNSYTGGTTLGDGSHFSVVTFWNSAPFGSGAVSVLTNASQPVQLSAHGTQTLLNAFTFTNTGTFTLRSWDGPLTLSGPLTLGGNITFNGLTNPTDIDSTSGLGNVALPGPIVRVPFVISGNIGETGGARTLLTSGGGVFFLTGTNTYTGGTSSGGFLVFGSNAAVPATGTVSAGNYIGFGDYTAGQFASFLSTRFNLSGSTGGVGVDTMPGFATATFSDAFNFTSANAGLRIGTATSAIITGTITPQGANYQFGNGGGTLYVQSNLTLSKGLTLNTSSTNFPLTVFLQGYNVYNGNTTVTNGYLVMDGPSALSVSTPALIAGGAATNVGASYISYTDVAGVANPAAFLAKFTPASTWGIIGFDTHAGNSTVNIANVNLTGFNDGVFLGTLTSAIIDASTVTPTTVTNGNNAANFLRFTAAQSGVLTLNGNITGSVGLMLGSPSLSSSYSSGTVIVNGVNTYSGATKINAAGGGGLTVSLGNNSALSSGTINVLGTNGGRIGLAAQNPGLNLPNNIALTTVSGTGPTLEFVGSQNYTLSGNITGDVSTILSLYNTTPLTISLAGDNSGFLGTFFLSNGTANFLHNLAAGSGLLNFGFGSQATVNFAGAATNPVVYGIIGDAGTIHLGTSTLTFDISSSSLSQEFGGTIADSGNVIVTAPTASGTSFLNLYGANSYTGTTSVLNQAVVGASHNSALGTGPLVLNAPSGGLYIGPGVTVNNSLTFSAGLIGGFGTVGSGTTGNLVVGTNTAISGGFVGFDPTGGRVGQLTIGTNVTFADGGLYIFGLRDPSYSSDGYSFLNIPGNLTLTATAGGFTIKVETFDYNNDLGDAALTVGTPYSIPILTAGSGIAGFDPNSFTVDASEFQSGLMSSTVFTVSQTGNTLYLNFTPVPEPSTYVLLGLGLLGLAGVSRRRARKL